MNLCSFYQHGNTYPSSPKAHWSHTQNCKTTVLGHYSIKTYSYFHLCTDGGVGVGRVKKSRLTRRKLVSQAKICLSLPNHTHRWGPIYSACLLIVVTQNSTVLLSVYQWTKHTFYDNCCESIENIRKKQEIANVAEIIFVPFFWKFWQAVRIVARAILHIFKVN